MDSLTRLFASTTSTPARRAVMVSLEVSSMDFGKLHHLLGGIRDALSRRSDPQGMPMVLNVHSWHTRSTMMMCGQGCPGGGCGDSPREDGLWGEDPDPNAPNLIDSLRAMESDSESKRPDATRSAP